mgnify:CR=1 FL=1
MLEEENQESSWPPSEDSFQSIANSALKQSNIDKFKVLVYWENNPNLMIFNPVHFANTRYLQKTYEESLSGRQVTVIIGEID